uniref:Beta-defensin n=1 Tax=Sus scrofa TaxID=9823 RepID=A0A8D1VSU3_PIG
MQDHLKHILLEYHKTCGLSSPKKSFTMKILLFFSTFLFFGVFIPPVGSGQTVGNSDSSSKIMCRRKLETLYSEARNSSTTSENTQYGTEENKTAKRKEHTVALNRRLACTMLGGQCKNKCGEKEFRIIYCERPTTLCCMRECDSKK